jgi:DNA polymerase elongation subunit (family B)
LILATNGLLFKSEEGFIPKAVKLIFAKRKEFKDLSKKFEKMFQETGDKQYDILAKRYDAFQNAVKILANASYGILANENFRLFDPDLASAVTLTGQKLTKFLVKNTNELFQTKFDAPANNIVAADTDSLYINFESFMKKYNIPEDNSKVIAAVNLFWKKIYEPFLKDTLGKFSHEYLNNPENWFHLKREAITDGAIFTGKKHYALNVIDNEGVTYKEPKIKVKGIEIVRSSTPSFCRERIKDIVKAIFKSQTKQQVNELLKEINSTFKKEPIKNIAFPRGVKDIDSYIENGQFKKGVPIHVRAAVNYNKLIDKYKLERDCDIIKSGSKMKFIYLKTNAFNQENIIGFVDDLPKEFKLHGMIDYDIQFEKSFMQPLHKITEAIGWGRLDISVADISEFF